MPQNLESGPCKAGGTGKSADGALLRETAPGTGQAGSNVKEGGVMAGGLREVPWTSPKGRLRGQPLGDAV